MKINLYKKAAKDIVVNPELIHDTANKMRMVQQNKKTMIKRYAIVSCLAAVIMGTLLLPGIESITPNIPSNPEGGLATPNNGTNQGKATVPDQDIVLPQITKNYAPFQATEYNSVKVPAPNIPFAKAEGPNISLSYEELKQKSNTIILCTISDIGIYRNKAEQYHPKASFGTYIYTVEIDKILSGNMQEAEGSLIPIAETAWANPELGENGNEIIDWNFYPYSARPNDVKSLEKGKQYVMFLSQKDDTEVYRLSWDGFGIFPIDYINEEVSRNSLIELQKQYKYVEEVSRAPMENNLLYRLCTLYVKEEFL